MGAGGSEKKPGPGGLPMSPLAPGLTCQLPKHLLQFPSAVLLSLLLELPEGPPKALQLRLLHPQLPHPTPSPVTEGTGTYQALPQMPSPSAPVIPAPGPRAHLDSEGFCGVLGLLKPALELHQGLCLLLQEGRGPHEVWSPGGGGTRERVTLTAPVSRWGRAGQEPMQGSFPKSLAPLGADRVGAKAPNTWGALAGGPGPQCCRRSRVRARLCLRASFSRVRC